MLASEARDLKARKAGKVRNKAVLHIRGMDAGVTKEDIITAIKAHVEWDKTECTISAFRPYGRNSMAVTVVMEEEEECRLVSRGTITVDLVRCNVERRVNVNRCKKCWSYDHRREECSGPDRSKACFKCGQEGHVSKECEARMKCVLCETDEHKQGTLMCPAYRKALTGARLEARLALKNNAPSNKDKSHIQGEIVGAVAAARCSVLGAVLALLMLAGMSCLRVLQLNLDRHRTAHDILIQTIKEHNIDVVNIISIL